jgi:CHAT domain-containing protein/tetratricopeptide (TPR) repeat protein
MLNFKKTIGMLILNSASLLLWSQCPDDLNVNTTLKTNDIEKVTELIFQLENCPDQQDSLAFSFHKLGILYYSKRDDLDSSILFTEQGLGIRQKLFVEKPNIDLGKSYHNLGVFYAELRKNKKAQRHLESAIRVYKNLNESRLLRSYLELANVHRAMGEYELAENYFNLVIPLAKKLEDNYRLANALSDYGRLLNTKKEYLKASQYLQQSRLIFEEEDSPQNLAACYSNLSISYFNLGQFAKSIFNLKEAIKINEEYEDCEEIAKLNNNLGVRYQKNNQNQLAFLTLKKGLKAAQSCNSKDIIAQSHDNLGEYYLAKKDYKKALSHFQKAIQALIPRFERKKDWHNPTKMDVELAYNKIDLLTYLGDKAKTLQLLTQAENDSKYLTSALQLFELGDVIIDQLRKEHQDQNTKLFWRKEAIPFYENAIEVCYEMQDVEKAFFFFEKSKAILLLEALQTSDALELIPDSLKNHILSLQQDLLKIKENLENANFVGAERESIIRELVGMQEEFEFEVKQLAMDYPKFYEVKFGTKVISLDEAKSEYSELFGKTSIHFFYGEKNIYAITIHLQKSKLHQIGQTLSVEKEIRNLLSFFEKSSNIENAPNDFLQQSKKVYDILIAPLSIGTEEEVIIFSDGALAYLPFEALVIDESNDLASANYLIKNQMIYYGYSATIFSKLNKYDQPSNENSIVGFAPFADGSTNSKYATLAFSQDELGEISQQVQGIFLKNQAATKQYFLDNSNQFSILHLSTHAFSSAAESKPQIVFADTSLFLSELYGLDIPADLVVLSACQSNIGKLSPGEGVMSLGRGFTFAGSKSLVSSLWNVNAVSTSTILSGFYKNLQNKESKYESLHAAKLAYLENENIPSYERSPYYWAGLIYYGDDGGVILQEKKDHWFFVKVLLFIFILLAGFIFFKKK